MDPDAAIDAILTALDAGETTVAVEALMDLEEWLAKGGSPPSSERLKAIFAKFRSGLQAVNVDLELDLVRDMLNRVAKPEIRKRLQAVIENPTAKTWDNAYTIILNPRPGMGLTLWQAVMAVDPTFPPRGPVHDSKGRLLQGWPRIPSRDLLIAALKYATH